MTGCNSAIKAGPRCVAVAEHDKLPDAKLATIVAGQRPPDLTRDEAVAYDVAANLEKFPRMAGNSLQDAANSLLGLINSLLGLINSLFGAN
jgi:hypothetical protein